MLIYNYINDLVTYYKYKIKDFYNYLLDYFSGDHDTWIFIPGHTLPLSINNIYNTCSAIWIYNNRKCALNIFSDSDEKLVVKFSWLSAKICITTKENEKIIQYEYDMDEFLDKFRVLTFLDAVPTLRTIYLTWCTYSKHWFSEDSFVEFLIIDDNGEEQTLTIDDDNNCLEIKHNKIYVVVHSDSPNNEQNEVIHPLLPASPETTSDQDEVKNKYD